MTIMIPFVWVCPNMEDGSLTIFSGRNDGKMCFHKCRKSLGALKQVPLYKQVGQNSERQVIFQPDCQTCKDMSSL